MPIEARSPAADRAPPADLVERFAGALARLRPKTSDAGGRIGLAVSGGPDSMAMLLLAHAAIPGGFEVASVDHGLRPEAAEECALVERVCEARGIACAVLQIEVGLGNLQAQARDARYTALAVWAGVRGLSAIATAHHADDQAETLLMRLNRGSGIAGLAGVRERLYLEELEIMLIRPVLTFRRAELTQVVEIAGVETARDPSNEDDMFERVRIRKALIEADWLDPVAIAKSAAHLAEAEEALMYVTADIWSRRVARQDNSIVFSYDGWRAVHLRIIKRAVSELGTPPRGQDVARLLDRLEQGEGGNLGGVLVTYDYRPGHGLYWIFRAEPPRHNPSIPSPRIKSGVTK